MATDDTTRKHTPVWVFALLYFSEGAPIGFLWWALPTILRVEGVSIERITGLTALLVLPWTGKFLWAPLVDVLRGPRWGYRHWVVTAQLLMGCCLVPLIWLDPVAHTGFWIALLLAHAFCAATQDVAIDALAITTSDPAQRGWLNGAMQAGMLLARGLFGGLAILAASRFGLPAVVGALLLSIWITIVFVVRFVAESAPDAARRAAVAGFFGCLGRVLKQRTTWLGFGFALTAGAGFEAMGAMAGPSLIDAGLDPSITGAFFAFPVVLSMLAGGLLGGRLADRFDRRRTVAAFLVILCLLVAGVGWAHLAGSGGMVLIETMTAAYIAIGLFTAASYGLFMDLTDSRLGATQFSAYMAATNGCEAWAAAAGGRLAGNLGYGPAFVIMPAIGLLGGLFLWLMGRREGTP